MKKFYLVLAGLMFAAAAATAQEQTVAESVKKTEAGDRLHFFVKGGIGLSEWTASVFSPNFSFNVGGGAMYDLPVKNLSAEASLRFSYKSISNKANLGSIFGASISTKTLYYGFWLDLPLEVRYGIDIVKNHRVSLGTGPYLAVGLFGRQKIEVGSSNPGVGGGNTRPYFDLYRRFDMGWIIDLRYEYRHIIAGMEFMPGFINVQKGADVRMFAMYFYAGYKF